MKRRLLAIVLACVLALAFSSVALAAPPSGSAVISNELSSSVNVAAVPAQWSPTGRMGTQAGTVYKEFELLAGSPTQRVSLASSNVSSITVLEPGSTTAKTLTPNTDETLWFNVAKPKGDYKFTVTLINGTVYEATLAWSGPMQLLDITWDLPTTYTTGINQSFEVNTTAAIKSEIATAGVSEIGRVLYIIEVTKSDGTAATRQDVTAFGPPASSGGQLQELGYDETGEFFFWGPRSGFTFSTSMYDGNGKVNTKFTVTFKKPGTYSITAYAVQLPQ